MDTKKCSKCKKDLELASFCKDKHSKDGLYHYCRDCNNSRSRQYRKPIKNLEPARTSQEAYSVVREQALAGGFNKKEASDIAFKAATKRCRKCNEDKKLEHFGINKYQADGLNYYCLQCERQRVKKYGKAGGCPHCGETSEAGVACDKCAAIYSEAWSQARAGGATTVECKRYAKQQLEILK